LSEGVKERLQVYVQLRVLAEMEGVVLWVWLSV